MNLLRNSTMKAEVEKKLGEQVLAVGELRQGRPPSMASMLTGAALIALLRPRPSMTLPKHFLLAVTPSRVVALHGRGVSDEDGADLGAVVGGEAGSWSRGEIMVSDLREESHSISGTLEIPAERIPVFDPGMGGARESALLEMLAG
jgi:hypothetical protein